MALAAAALRSLLKDQLHKDSTFTDPDDLNSFLTLGQKRIVKDCPWGLGKKQASITTASSTQEYSLSSDFYQLVRMWDSTNGMMVFPSESGEWVDWIESMISIPTGPPDTYHVLGYDTSNSAWRVRLYPTPDAAYTVKYWYYWMPSDISGTNTPPHSAIGFEELILWAATMIARERNDPEGHVQAFQNYQALLKELKGYSPQGPNQVHQLKAQGERGGGSTLRFNPSHFPAF